MSVAAVAQPTAVDKWLEEVGLSQYSQALKNEEIEHECVLAEMTPTQRTHLLSKLKFENLPDKVKFKKALETLKPKEENVRLTKDGLVVEVVQRGREVTVRGGTTDKSDWNEDSEVCETVEEATKKFTIHKDAKVAEGFQIGEVETPTPKEKEDTKVQENNKEQDGRNVSEQSESEEGEPLKVLDGLRISISGSTKTKRTTLVDLIKSHGGRFTKNVRDKRTTHLITTRQEILKRTVKCKKASDFNIPMLSEKWIHDSIHFERLQDVERYEFNTTNSPEAPEADAEGNVEKGVSVEGKKETTKVEVFSGKRFVLDENCLQLKERILSNGGIVKKRVGKTVNFLVSTMDDVVEVLPKSLKEMWLRCSYPECQKWRKVPHNIMRLDDYEKAETEGSWMCSFNLDSTRTNCEDEEELRSHIGLAVSLGVPIVKEEFVTKSITDGKLAESVTFELPSKLEDLPLDAQIPQTVGVLDGLFFYLSGELSSSRRKCEDLINANGGCVSTTLKGSTHLISNSHDVISMTRVVKKAFKKRIHVVSEDFILDSIKEYRLQKVENYHLMDYEEDNYPTSTPRDAPRPSVASHASSSSVASSSTRRKADGEEPKMMDVKEDVGHQEVNSSKEEADDEAETQTGAEKHVAKEDDAENDAENNAENDAENDEENDIKKDAENDGENGAQEEVAVAEEEAEEESGEMGDDDLDEGVMADEEEETLFFDNLNFCFTGIKNRKTMIRGIEQRGGTCHSKIDKTADYLITTQEAFDSQTLKIRKAQKKNVAIVFENFIRQCLKRERLLKHDAYIVHALEESDSSVAHVVESASDAAEELEELELEELFEGKHFVLDDLGGADTKIRRLIEDGGGNVSKNVNKHTDYVVITKSQSKTSKKVKVANARHIPVVFQQFVSECVEQSKIVEKHNYQHVGADINDDISMIFSGKAFVIVGRKLSVQLDVLKAMITERGGTIKTAVSTKVDFLVTTSETVVKGNQRIREAVSYKIPIVSVTYICRCAAQSRLLDLDSKRFLLYTDSDSSEPGEEEHKEESCDLILRGSPDRIFKMTLQGRIVTLENGRVDKNLKEHKETFRNYDDAKSSFDERKKAKLDAGYVVDDGSVEEEHDKMELPDEMDLTISADKHSSDKHTSDKPPSDKHPPEKPSSEKPPAPSPEKSSENPPSEKPSPEKPSPEKPSPEKPSPENPSPEKPSSDKHPETEKGHSKKALPEKGPSIKPSSPTTNDTTLPTPVSPSTPKSPSETAPTEHKEDAQSTKNKKRKAADEPHTSSSEKRNKISPGADVKSAEPEKSTPEQDSSEEPEKSTHEQDSSEEPEQESAEAVDHCRFENEKTKRFYELSLDGKSIHTSYGRIGKKHTSNTVEKSSKAEAEEFYVQKLNEKSEKKGYAAQTQSGRLTRDTLRDESDAESDSMDTSDTTSKRKSLSSLSGETQKPSKSQKVEKQKSNDSVEMKDDDSPDTDTNTKSKSASGPKSKPDSKHSKPDSKPGSDSGAAPSSKKHKTTKSRISKKSKKS